MNKDIYMEINGLEINIGVALSGETTLFQEKVLSNDDLLKANFLVTLIQGDEEGSDTIPNISLKIIKEHMDNGKVSDIVIVEEDEEYYKLKIGFTGYKNDYSEVKYKKESVQHILDENKNEENTKEEIFLSIFLHNLNVILKTMDEQKINNYKNVLREMFLDLLNKDIPKEFLTLENNEENKEKLSNGVTIMVENFKNNTILK